MSEGEQARFDRGEMVMVHTMFRREFGLIPALIRATSDGEQAKIIADHFRLLADTLHHHHRGEDDFVWPLLVERAGESAALIRLMDDQHRGIAARLDIIRKRLGKWCAGDPGLMASTLADDVTSFVDLLNEHLRTEEDHVVPLMEVHITADEFDRGVQQAAVDVDPATLPLTFGMLMYEGEPTLVDRALAHMTSEARPITRDLATRVFADHAVRVHGTPTPRRSNEI